MMISDLQAQTALNASNWVVFKWGAVYGHYAPVLKIGEVVERRLYRGMEEVRVRFEDRGTMREKWIQGWMVQ